MELLLTGKQMTDADRYTSESIGIPSLVLMERAALSIREEIRKIDPDNQRSAVVLCGKGNNGADGLALVRLLTEDGRKTTAVLMPGELRDGSSSKLQMHILSGLSIHVMLWGSDEWKKAEEITGLMPENFLLIDSISGTGLSGNLHGAALEAADYCNRMRRAGAYVLAVDMPSGVDAADGRASDTAVYADLTVTFGFRKLGSVLFPGALHCGRVVTRDIGIPVIAAAKILRHEEAGEHYFTLDQKDAGLIPERAKDGNKGTFGKILLLAGSRGMAGAAILCAEAALRSGAGMVKVITPESNRAILQQRLPEAMLTTYPDHKPEEAAAEIGKSVRWADSFAAGPGLGNDENAAQILSCFIDAVSLKETRPVLILDADALRLIAGSSVLQEKCAAAKNRIRLVMTPHPGEFAALCGKSIAESKENRLQDGRTISGRFNAVMVLKDARTIVLGADEEERDLPDGIFVNCLGNDGMATAGSGDVLTGIIAAMSCRFANRFDAAAMGVLLHAAAGDMAAMKKGKDGMTAADIANCTGMVMMTDRKAE